MRTRNIIILCVLGVVSVLIGWMYYSGAARKTFSWHESYDPESKQPYGTYFLRSLLESYRNGGTFTINERTVLRKLLPDLEQGTDLVVVGHATFLNTDDVRALARFIEKGNDVFIASIDPPYDLIREIKVNQCGRVVYYNSWKEDAIVSNFVHEKLFTPVGYMYKYRFGALDRPYIWNSLADDALCSEKDNLVALGYHSDQRVDFFKIPYGNGNLYLHANPLVFTNYFLSQKDKLPYANGVFSHLNGKHIVWDESSKLPFAASNRNDYNSPLYFIMEQPALKYAWWMILATVVLFVIFAAKRKQEIIPVLEPKSNTSLEFVTLISALHFQNQDHLDMARKKMKYFLYFIRSRYGIQTSALTAAHVPILAERSKVKLADVNILYDRWNVIEHFGHHQIEQERLINLYTAIDHFYRNCK